ncbi:(2Fe-2S)-binding protein [Cloacibacillus sp.]|uniref:(2Fe-2S)-binding protein n=1 Tax=Cloacibacillus sp. TaxID=2049023 RepID=UPI0025C5AD45|nr:(2Fe-2S)-binding protein [Cloacibacillus sp.]MCC8056346.1 (2Fe-2S)-binding protein [Cloacibacillus sp.]
MDYKIEILLNGESCSFAVSEDEMLLDTIRVKAGLEGCKRGCDSGECGACTVLLDGQPVNSCSYLSVQADGRSVVTIEGLTKGTELHPVQQAFYDAGAVQCGYCIPGMVLSAKALLDKNPVPSSDEIRKALSGNLCRCTGYTKIEEAVQLAAERLGGGAR